MTTTAARQLVWYETPDPIEARRLACAALAVHIASCDYCTRPLLAAPVRIVDGTVDLSSITASAPCPAWMQWMRENFTERTDDPFRLLPRLPAVSLDKSAHDRRFT